MNYTQLFLLVIASTLTKCSVAPKSPPQQNNNLASVAQPRDPATAKVSIGPISLTTADIGHGFSVPGFVIALSSADYVEVVRCDKRFILTTNTGQKINELPINSPTRSENLRSALSFAKASNTSCKVIGDKISKQYFNDLSAATGDYYYIVNPCISPENSTLAHENCSYEIQITDAISYTSELSGEFINATQALYSAENKLSATFSRLFRLSELMKNVQDSCDANYFAIMAHNQMIKAAIDLVGIGLQTAISSYTEGEGTSKTTKTVGQVGNKALGMLRTLFANTPSPQRSCTQFEMLQQEGQTYYNNVDPNLRELSAAQERLSQLNSNYMSMDKAILESLQKNN